MAIISGLKYEISINGNTYISDLYYSNQYVPTSKVELEFNNITNANGEINIPLVGLDLIKTIIAKSDNMTVKLYNSSGLINRYDITGMMLNEISPVVASGIVSGSVSTIDTVGISASITLIGYV
jgi:hypothetical protein